MLDIFAFSKNEKNRGDRCLGFRKLLKWVWRLIAFVFCSCLKVTPASSQPVPLPGGYSCLDFNNNFSLSHGYHCHLLKLSLQGCWMPALGFLFAIFSFRSLEIEVFILFQTTLKELEKLRDRSNIHWALIINLALYINDFTKSLIRILWYRTYYCQYTVGYTGSHTVS